MGSLRGRRRRNPRRDLRAVRARVPVPEVGLIKVGELSGAPVRRGTSAAIMSH